MQTSPGRLGKPIQTAGDVWRILSSAPSGALRPHMKVSTLDQQSLRAKPKIRIRGKCQMAYSVPTSAPTPPDATIGNHPHSDYSQRLMDLGYIAGKRVTLYGEHFEIASDPFIDGTWVAVRVIGENDSSIKTIRLPVSILIGLTNLLPPHAG